MMKSLLKIALVATSLLLASCASIQNKINKDIQAVSRPDLEQALVEANAAGNKDYAACWASVLKDLDALPTNSAAPQHKILGLATLLEAQHEDSLQPLPALPKPSTETVKACSVVVWDAKLSLVDFIAKLGLHKLP